MKTFQPGHTFKGPVDQCPQCQRVVTRHTTATGGPKPAEGSIAVCAYCGAILRFDAQMHLRPIAPETLAALPARERQFIAMLRQALARYGPD
jgi:hypothetical protein